MIKVRTPGGSPARHAAPVRRGVSLAFAVRNAGKRGVVLDLTLADDEARFHELLDHADVLVTSSAKALAHARRARRCRRPPAPRGRRHHAVRARRPLRRLGGTDATWRRVGGSRSRRVFRTTSRCCPGSPGRRRRIDHERVRAPVRALPARAHRRRAVRRDLRQRGDRADLRLVAPNAMARIEAGFPAGEVRNGNGPSIRSSRARAGTSPHHPERPPVHRHARVVGRARVPPGTRRSTGFVARREIASTCSTLVRLAFCRPEHGRGVARSQKAAASSARSVTPADIPGNEHFASRGTFVDLEVGPASPHRSVGVLRGRRRAGRTAGGAARRSGSTPRRSSRRWGEARHTSGERPARGAAARGPAGHGLRSRARSASRSGAGSRSTAPRS